MTAAAQHAAEAAALLEHLDASGADRHFVVQLVLAHAMTALALDVTEERGTKEKS